MNFTHELINLSVLDGLGFFLPGILPVLLMSSTRAYTLNCLEKSKIKVISHLFALVNSPYGIRSFLGRYSFHKIREEMNKSEKGGEKRLLLERSINPVGSPYGFIDDDWDFIYLRKEDWSTLYVVLGFQFKSDYYITNQLVNNISEHLQKAVTLYNSKHPGDEITMHFEILTAGYGEHLFNTVARSIISSDISIFEVSDQNSNVMIELGVALTWGVRTIPLRERNSPEPPSDISGHTYIVYEKSGKKILDKEFHKKLVKMIEKTILRKKRLYFKYRS
jgi:hypothetical protein